MSALRTLAADLRPMTLPMALTLGRLALVPAFLLLVVTHHPWAALALFAAMAVSDHLDGRLARRWGQTTRLGLLLDPAADKVLVSCSLVLLAAPAFAPGRFAIPWAVPLGVFLKDLGVMTGIAVVVRRTGRVELNANRAGKWSTTLDLVLVIGTLAFPLWLAAGPAFAATLLWALWWATVWAAAAAGAAYTIEGARQLRAAAATVPPPPAGGRTAPSAGTTSDMGYESIITLEPDKRGGKPCIRGLRITVYDVLDYLASGMSEAEVIDDFPELTADDIRACLAFAADRERRLLGGPR